MNISTSKPITFIDHWRQQFGITPGNPFAGWVVAVLVISATAAFILLLAALFGPSTQFKYNAGITFLFVAVLSPIPAGMLALYSRNYARMQRIVNGDHWAHWTYSLQEQSRCAPFIQGDEVYISPHGIYWPAKRLYLRDFSSGLVDVRIIDDSPQVLWFQYLYKVRGRYGAVLAKKTQEHVVPIPHGCEAEAQALVQKFRHERLGVPSQSLNDQWSVGWVIAGLILLMTFISIAVTLPLEFAKTDEKWANYRATSAAADATQSVILNANFASIRPVIERQLPAWQAEGERYTHELTAAQAGFKPGDNVQQVIYGYCPDQTFYAVVLEKQPSQHYYLADTGGYGYWAKGSPYNCLPTNWETARSEPLGDGWYYVGISTRRATLIPMLTEIATLYPSRTPAPEATAPAN